MVDSVRQGDVFWIDFGLARGSSPAYRHPCVVVQSDAFNRSRIGTTVVCLITSNTLLSRAPGNVRLPKDEAGLPRESVVNVTQLLTVDKGDLEDRIGRLRPLSMEAVLAGLRLLFEHQ